MRRSLPSLFLLAALGGCGGSKDDAQDIREVDQQLASDNLVDNDLTAIDAVTGADANMAADVDPSTITDVSEGDGNATATRRPAGRPATPANDSANDDEPADTPAPSPAPAPAAANSSESN